MDKEQLAVGEGILRYIILRKGFEFNDKEYQVTEVHKQTEVRK